MFPGVLQPPTVFPDFAVQSPCFVTLVGNGAAVAVCVTSCSRDDIVQNGCTGKRVTIYHCYKDHLWAAGEKDPLPMLPDFICMMAPAEGVEIDLPEENPELCENAEIESDIDALTI